MHSQSLTETSYNSMPRLVPADSLFSEPTADSATNDGQQPIGLEPQPKTSQDFLNYGPTYRNLATNYLRGLQEEPPYIARLAAPFRYIEDLFFSSNWAAVGKAAKELRCGIWRQCPPGIKLQFSELLAKRLMDILRTRLRPTFGRARSVDCVPIDTQIESIQLLTEIVTFTNERRELLGREVCMLLQRFIIPSNDSDVMRITLVALDSLREIAEDAPQVIRDMILGTGVMTPMDNLVVHINAAVKDTSALSPSNWMALEAVQALYSALFP